MKRFVYLILLLTLLLAACEDQTMPTPTPEIETTTPTPTDTAIIPTERAVPITTPTETTPPIARPFPQHTPYAPNTILPNHRTQEQLDNDLRTFYDYWKAAYLVEAGPSANGPTMYRIAFGKDGAAHDRTVSEGQGYGMVILPLIAGYDPDAQAIFDGLWEFVRAHPSENDPRLMDWNIPDPQGNASAFDGDVDIALGLLLADAQWGSSGRINYQAEAQQLIAAILDSTIGPESRLPLLGDWVNPSGSPHNQYTPRSSDFVLANFRAFAQATNDPVWNEIIQQSHTLMQEIQSSHSPETGLLPDFIILEGQQYQPAPPNFLENTTDGAYYYNAGRTPWRVGLDALLSDDPTSRAIVQKISHWIQAETDSTPTNIRAGYELNGTPLPNSSYFTTFFAAPFTIAAMTDPAQQQWLNTLYDAVYNRQENYYEDSVNLLCLLIVTGNFWVP